MGIFKNWFGSKQELTDKEISNDIVLEDKNKLADAKKEIVIPQSLPEAIRLIAEVRGTNFLCERAFINMLNDYRLLKGIPALKNVLVSMQEDGYVQKLITANTWELDSATIRMQYVNTYGTRDDIVAYVIESFGYGLNHLSELPTYQEVKTGDNLSPQPNSIHDQEQTFRPSNAATQPVDPYDPREPYTSYSYPKIDLLNPPSDRPEDEEEARKDCDKVIQVLHSFGFELASITIHVGPSIDFFEIIPENGARLSRLKGIEDNISAALSTKNVRLLLPIPGTSNVGIEVPAKNPQKLGLRNILDSQTFADSKMILPCALGLDMKRNVFMFDLIDMPNILIAGATGQGKTNCMNDIIMSLLYKKHPHELKMIFVDFKKVELSSYCSAVQFLAVSDSHGIDEFVYNSETAEKTFVALKDEFDGRYDLFARAHCRNIAEYNSKFIARLLNPAYGHEYLPFIVVFIDEYSDLMAGNKSFLEPIIQDLIQKGRNVGIHFVISTNRPTADVMSSSIKMQMASRIAFKVSKSSESRIIIDSNGAEKLIGNGDMLFVDSSGNLQRVQCALVDYDEINKVCFSIEGENGSKEPYQLKSHRAFNASSRSTDTLDPLIADVARLVVTSQNASTSFIQRSFSISYSRAAHIMDQLEKAGVIGHAMGAMPRKVLINDTNVLLSILSKVSL